MSTQKIFFSYSRVDSPFALKLAKDLREAGADIWIDQLDIPAGSHWDAAVEKALNTAAYVLVILTPASTASTNVMDEVSFALESGKKIIPVLLEDCLPPFRLRRLQRIDFTTDYDNGFKQLIISLNLTLGTTMVADAQDGDEPRPVTTGGNAPADPQEKERRDHRLWEDACKLNTIAAYKKYLLESPHGSFTEEAGLMIKQLEVEQKEDELEALLWQKTKSEHSKNLYLHYLQQYPQGNYRTLALAAIADFEKTEKEEERRQKELAQKQEQERVLKAKEEKEKQDRLEKERQQKEKEEKEKALALERERAQKEKEEKEKALAIEKEKARVEREAREKQLQEERARAQKEKEEQDRIKQQEKEKLQREKEEREKQRLKEKEEANLLRQQEKEKARQEKLARGETEATSGNTKKYALIGGGILLLVVAIWAISGMGSDQGEKDAWSDALQKNDSTSYATYMQKFPEGKFTAQAKQRIDSIYWAQKAVLDSLNALEAGGLAANTPVEIKETPKSETKTESSPAQTPEQTKTQKPATPEKNTSASKPKQTATPNKPKENVQTPPPGKITLGQDYGGGIVIYITPKGDHGMIVSSKEVGSVDWEKAKKICEAYKVGNFAGWRLPSKDELNIIYQNRKYLGNYAKGGYWSSTEEGKNSAMSQNFTNGNIGKSNKSAAMSVRAVRPF